MVLTEHRTTIFQENLMGVVKQTKHCRFSKPYNENRRTGENIRTKYCNYLSGFYFS